MPLLIFCVIPVAYIAWRDDPVMTSVKTTGHQIDKLEFPAITICGLGMIEATLDRAYGHQITEFLKTRNVTVDAEEDGDIENYRHHAEDMLYNQGLFGEFLEELYPGKKRGLCFIESSSQLK